MRSTVEFCNLLLRPIGKIQFFLMTDQQILRIFFSATDEIHDPTPHQFFFLTDLEKFEVFYLRLMEVFHIFSLHMNKNGK